LGEITPLLSDDSVWYPYKQTKKIFEDANQFFLSNPDCIPFSNFLAETIPNVIAVFKLIPLRLGFRFETSYVKAVLRESLI